MNVLRVCPFSRLSSCESASKGIKCFVQPPNGLLDRQRCTYGGLVHTSRCYSFFFLWHVLSSTEKPFVQLLEQMSLLHFALVQVLRGGRLKCIKNPEGRRGTSGLRLGTSYVPVRRCLRSSTLPL